MNKSIASVPAAEYWLRLGWPLRLGLFFCAYIGAAQLGHWLSLTAPNQVATFWPPSGLYLAVLLQTRQRRWPALVMAALAANLAADTLLHDRPLLLALGFAMANTLEALSGAWLCQRALDEPFRLDRLGVVLVFAAVTALVSTVLGATVGTLTLMLGAAAPFAPTWLGWWSADVVGTWIIAPLVLALGSGGRPAMWPLNALRWIEGAVMLAGLVGVAGFIFMAAYAVLGVPFFVLPFLLWAALRLGVGGTAVAVFVLALIAMVATLQGQGPFIRANLTPLQQVVSVQSFLSICALCFQSLAAVTAERWRATAALRRVNAELERRVEKRTRELAQANRILQASEQHLRNILDSLFAFVGVLTPDGVLLEANRAPLEAAGLFIEEVRGNYFWDCYWWNYDSQVQQQVRTAVARAAAGEMSRFDVTVRMARGSRMTIDFMLVPLRDEHGRITHLIPSGIDVSERKRAERALAASETRVKQQLAEIEAVYQTAPVGLCVFDRELRFLRINERLAEINGIPAAEHLGKTLRELLPSLADTAEAALEAVLTTVKPVLNVELTGETPAQPGVVRSWIENWYPLCDDDGVVIGVNIVAEEVTERKRINAEREALLAQVRQEQARLETILQQLPAGVILADAPSGRIVYTNAKARELFGDRSCDTVNLDVYSRWTMLHPDGQPVAVHELPMLRALRGGETLSNEEVMVLRLDDAWRHFSVNAAPIRAADGSVIAGVVIFIDITERKQTEQALEAARAAAEAANQAKSQFLANMSHEIRSPMSAVLGYADILAAHLDDPDDLACTTIIQRNGQHLLALINDILDLSKIEAGRLEIVRERFAPDRLIAEVHSLMAVRAQEKGLGFEIICASALPETVETDMRRLKQILINLIGNAIKFTEAGSVTLRVEVMEDSAAAKLRFDVIDTGIGMTEADQGKLFQPFSQLDSSLTREHSGSGLGLAISQRLARLLGGEISVHSPWRKGSTFTLTVAIGSLEGVARVAPRLQLAEDAATGHGVGGTLRGRLLVVDDRHDIRYLAQRYLEEAGAEVATAEGGAAALAAVADAERAGQRFDAVVLDMQMPGMDGYAVARKLRARGYEAPIVALTAHAMKGDREKCLAAGCDEYLSKPVDRQRLVTLLARLIKPARSSPARLSAADAPAQTEYRVLVVDDNRDAATALSGMLRLLGYQVTTAHDGGSALAAARAEAPHVVILDLNLPDMSGYEVCQQLKREPSLAHTRFIALSGEDAVSEKAKAAGFDHHQLKPASVSELIALFPGQ